MKNSVSHIQNACTETQQLINTKWSYKTIKKQINNPKPEPFWKCMNVPSDFFTFVAFSPFIFSLSFGNLSGYISFQPEISEKKRKTKKLKSTFCF